MFDHFVTLKSLENVDKESCDNFSGLLRDLQREFEERFKDITSLADDFRIFSLPFSMPVDDASPELQMELLELQASTPLKQKFQDVRVPDFYEFFDDAFFPALRR